MRLFAPLESRWTTLIITNDTTCTGDAQKFTCQTLHKINSLTLFRWYNISGPSDINCLRSNTAETFMSSNWNDNPATGFGKLYFVAKVKHLTHSGENARRWNMFDPILRYEVVPPHLPPQFGAGFKASKSLADCWKLSYTKFVFMVWQRVYVCSQYGAVQGRPIRTTLQHETGLTVAF